VLARFVPGRRIGGGCSAYVPAGGGYKDIVVISFKGSLGDTIGGSQLPTAKTVGASS
jgi:hypothetical protein